MTARVGHVAIGRNEGERLVACLASLVRAGGPIVYVDSGSTDGSVAAARSAGARVVALDMSTPFTAARARNEGLKAFQSIEPYTEYIQFIDGDCELAASWIGAARAHLDANADVAAVCGRRRERRPEASVYNRLCDREWDTPIGDALSCGGDVLMRRAAVEAVGGYRESLVAGEEPELCVRMREAGWRIVRLDAEMTRHDASILKFSQWWRRAMRGGHAFAEVSYLHRASPKRIWTQEAIRPLVWSAIAPLAVAASFVAGPVALLALVAYPAQIARIAARDARKESALTYAAFAMLAKFAEAAGVIKFWATRLTGGRSTLIEYKK